jgi:uncharacterized OB-fold protein
MTGTVYTETLIHAAPERFIAEAPYQVVIVTLTTGGRITGRVAGPAVVIDDRVQLVQEKDGVPYFQKI